MRTCRMHALALLVVGCSKSDGGVGGAPSASAVAVPGEAASVIAITGTPPVAPSAAPSASVATSATPSASAATRAGTGTGVPAASVKGIASAKAVETPVTPLKPASTRMSGKNFTLDASSPGCRVEVSCTMTLRLAATGDYHVNKEYPYKFLAAAAPGVQFLGSGDANTFSRAAGDFREDSEKAGTMTVRFKPTSAGEARVSGTYKMSVCSAENCQVETQAVMLAVPVM